ncbi:MAG: GntR family transcriptional regulator [Gemmatimonadaceae bacterium]
MISFATSGRHSVNGVRREDIAERLRKQIQSGLHLGRLTPGQRLPSTRELAAKLAVDQRRVTRAYHDLVMDGLVDLRPRSGFYVASETNGNASHLRNVAQWAVDTLVDAWQLGLRPADVADYLRECFASHQLTAACIECNDDQLHGLSSELESDFGFATQSVPLCQTGDDEMRTRLSEADLLVTTAFHKSEVRRLACKLHKPFLAITVRPDLLQSIEAALRSEDVYFVATDPRFAAKAASMFATSESTHQVHVLIAGRDELSAIPTGAPAYIMRRAREAIGEHPLAARVMPMRSVFARESRRAILSFIAQKTADRRTAVETITP